MLEDIAKQPVRGDIIQKALDSLNFMGLNIKDTLIEYFQSHGVILDTEHFYTLGQIEKEIQTLFGENATEILVQQIAAGISAQFRWNMLALPTLAGK